MTEREAFHNAWECAYVALDNLSYESPDLGSLSSDEINELTDCLKNIANWFDSQEEKCWQEKGLTKSAPN
ncbi:MAG: hypothetical protein HC852_11015 [Acaryochloridaceae cyanobacterium RU_4_10]|nr:hypothetical protein [Acaryochloridaceae cyanobacterium RU_4_10]